jgi:hypothetical protein
MKSLIVKLFRDYSPGTKESLQALQVETPNMIAFLLQAPNMSK